MRSDQSNADTSTGDSQLDVTRRAVLGSLGIATTTVLAGCTVSGEVDRETTTVQYSVAGSEVDQISVSGGDGETTIRGWDGTDVRVEATKYARGKTALADVTVSREVTGGHLNIEAEVSTGVGIGAFGGGFEAVDVRVPQGTRVTRLGIDDGSGEVTKVAGDITLNVDDGIVEAGPVEGDLDMTVDDGTVRLGDVGSVSGELDDGDLEMTEPATVGHLNVDDGDLELAIEDIDGDVTVQCDDGDITAQVVPTIDATVVAKADDNAVHLEGGLFDSVTTTEETTRGRIGEGTDRLTVEVDHGEVQMRPLRPSTDDAR